MSKATINLVTTAGPITGSGDISFPDGLVLPAGTTVEGIGLLNQNTASQANIAALLDAGVNGLVAAMGNTEYTMKVTTNTAIFSDSRSVYNGTSSAAVAAGVYTPAVAINAVGIGMGANRPSDGLWVNTVFIDASTGSATFLGTLTAGSVINGAVTNSSTGNSISTIDSNASTALTTKLNKNAADVLGGNITFTTSGAFQIGTATWNGSAATGTGIMYNQYGIVAVNAGTIEFVLNGSTGAATFSGALSAATGTFSGSLSAATGTFSGDVSTSGYIYATGTSSIGGISASIAGWSTSGNGTFGTTTQAGSAGVLGENTGGGPAIRAANAGGFGFKCEGYMTIDNTTLVTNLNAQIWGGITMNGLSTTATAGTATLPAAPAGFIIGVYSGTNYKIPYYNN